MSEQRYVGKARAPYLLSSYGPGSIVNLGAYALMPLSPDYWGGNLPTISAPLFKRSYNIDRLIDLRRMAEKHQTVKTILFPDDFYCAKCGLIQRPLSTEVSDLRRIRCSAQGCSGDLVVFRYVQYCHRGHIDRFGYRRFVHRGEHACDAPMYIRVRDGAVASVIRCGCGAEREIEFGKDAGMGRCSGEQPWLRSWEKCDEASRVSMRSSSDIYYSATRSSIAVEPEADPQIRTVLEFLADMYDPAMLGDSDVVGAIRKAKQLQGIPTQKISRAREYLMAAIESDTSGAARRIVKDEFAAFSQAVGNKTSDLWVEPQATSDWLMEQGIELITAVRKLREVRAIVGFNRGGQAPDPGFDPAGEAEEPVPISRVRTALGYENQGEGIFVRFAGGRIRTWLDRRAVTERSAEFFASELQWRKEFRRGEVAEHRMTYILAHTLAHLLIRSISLHCGYSQASLRERILTSPDCDEPWAGILIYTATSDADGSLGGLVGIALDESKFGEIFRHALSETSICSSDPICVLDAPGANGTLNAAACHACCIGPEPSCERGNRFLDRNLVTPNTLHHLTTDLCYFDPI